MTKFLRNKKVHNKLFCFKVGLILALLLSPLFLQQSFAQELSIQQTEAQLKQFFGLDKLKALNRLTEDYYKKRDRKALRYGRQAVNLGENIFTESNNTIDQSEIRHLLQAYFQLGQELYDRGTYFESQANLKAAKSLASQINNTTYSDKIETYLEKIQALLDAGEIKENFFSKTFGKLKVGEVISSASNDLVIESEIKLGQADENKGDLEKAIAHFEKAINLLRNKGDSERINELQLKIALLFENLNQHVEAQQFLDEAISEIESDLDSASRNIEIETFSDLPEFEPLRELKDQELFRTKHENLKDLSDNYARENNFEKSLAYYRLYQELSEKIETDSLETIIKNKQREGEVLLLRQQKKIADLNVEAMQEEKEKQVRLRNTYLLIALLILVATLVTLYFYVAKRREHKKLTITYRDLDKTKSKLVNAEKRIVKLLSQQLSVDVAKELLMNNSDKLGERRFVCVMFLDIRDFTPMAEKLSPEELIAYQNDVFGFMIDIVQQYNGNINQLLGDGFMATFGAPVSHGNDCQNAFMAAKNILREVNERSEARVIQKTKIGIGLHAGYVVTGNVGNESRKQYSVTGNPVIIASRVEQLNKTYKTQLIITEEVYDKLEKPLKLNQPFLDVKVKGRSNPVRILKIA